MTRMVASHAVASGLAPSTVWATPIEELMLMNDLRAKRSGVSVVRAMTPKEAKLAAQHRAFLEGVGIIGRR